MFLTLLTSPLVRTELLAGLVVAVLAGAMGPFVVARNMSFAVHGLAELGFTGAAGALVLGVDPVLGLLGGSLLVGAVIGGLGVRASERDSVIGSVLAFGLGLGVLLLAIYAQYTTAAFALLFGDPTAVTGGQLQLLSGVAAGVLVALAGVYRPLWFASVDPEVAEARGVPVRVLSVAFLLLLAVAVAEAVEVVGVLLILTLVVTPAATAARLTRRPAGALTLSVGLAVLASVGGIVLTLVGPLQRYPASVFVTGISFLAYLLARVAGPRLALRRRGGLVQP